MADSVEIARNGLELKLMANHSRLVHAEQELQAAQEERAQIQQSLDRLEYRRLAKIDGGVRLRVPFPEDSPLHPLNEALGRIRAVTGEKAVILFDGEVWELDLELLTPATTGM